MTRYGKRIGGTEPLSSRREMAFGKRVDGPAGRRRVKRSPVTMRGEMVTPSASLEVTLIDMSDTGARLHCVKLPAIGEEVSVRIGPMEASGTITWTEGNLCGVDFASPGSN